MKQSAERLGLASALCLAALVGCGSASTSAKSCSRIAVFDSAIAGLGQVWTKDEAREFLQGDITGDGRLVAVSTAARVRLVDAASGKELATANGEVGAGYGSLNVGGRLYNSGDPKAPSGSASQIVPLPSGGWINEVFKGGGGKPPTFVVLESSGKARSPELPGRAYAADAKGAIAVWQLAITEFDLATGAKRWTLQLPTSFDPKATLSDRHVVLTNVDNSPGSKVIDRSTGKMREITGTIVDVEGTLAIVRESVKLRRIDLDTDAVQWTTNFDVLQPLRVGTSFIGFDGVTMVALDVNDGTLAWSNDQRTLRQRVSDDSVLFYSYNSNDSGTTLELRDATTGAVQWTATAPIGDASVSVGGTRFVVTGSCLKRPKE
jgi:outer membrane protein assembly factor BamB